MFSTKNIDRMSMRELRNELRDARAENERLRAALERLASPEAFVVTRMTTEEEQARMRFAEAALQETDDELE